MDKQTVPLDFSGPWKLSDVVLVVEEQRFHVHRSTLAFWSPVFEKMFTSEFKEKNKDEIPLPGKKASEIKELLQIMYPSLEEKVVTKANCYFLLDLAREYQITSITQKCEDFLDSAVKTRKESDVLAVLIVGQEYELQKLIKTCVYEARRLSLKQLKDHSKRAEIEPDNYLQISERIIERLEEQCKAVKTDSLKTVRDLSKCLYSHIGAKGHLNRHLGGAASTYQFIEALKTDQSAHKCNSPSSPVCPGLSQTAQHLSELMSTIQSLP